MSFSPVHLFYQRCIVLTKLFKPLQVIIKRFFSFPTKYFSIHIYQSDFLFHSNYSLTDKYSSSFYSILSFPTAMFRLILCFPTVSKNVPLVGLQRIVAQKKPLTSYCNTSRTTCAELSVQIRFLVYIWPIAANFTAFNVLFKTSI